MHPKSKLIAGAMLLAIALDWYMSWANVKLFTNLVNAASVYSYGGNKWQILFNVWWPTVVVCYGCIRALSMTRLFSGWDYLISAIMAGLLTVISKDLFIGLYGLVIFYLAVLVCILGVTILLKPTFSSGPRYRRTSQYYNTSTSDDWCDDSGGSSGGGGSCGGD
jgi:uncharacterized membrane protein YgcG